VSAEGSTISTRSRRPAGFIALRTLPRSSSSGLPEFIIEHGDVCDNVDLSVPSSSSMPSIGHGRGVDLEVSHGVRDQHS
jgi:hypothetical protein